MVSDDAVRDIVMGPDGLVNEVTPKSTIINMSTVTPLMNSELQKVLTKYDISFLEAPVIGSVPQTEKGVSSDSGR